MKASARRVAALLSVLSLLLLACALTAWARGGGGGGGHGGGGGGGGGHSSGGGGSIGGGFLGGSHYYGGRSYGGSSGPQTPLTPEQAAAQRRQRNRMLAYGAGGVGAAAVGGGALWYGMTGFDLIALAFVLRRKRDYVGAIDKLVEDTNFADAESRDELLRNIGGLFATDDMEEAYAIPIPIKRNSDGTARQGAELDRQHQALADVKLQYQDGQKATAQGDREAAATDDDRCVLSVIVSAQRGLARRVQASAGSTALEALKLLASSGSPSVDGLWVFYVPALDEPLPADFAKMIFGNLHACDTNFKASDSLPEEAPEPEPGEDQRAA